MLKIVLIRNEIVARQDLKPPLPAESQPGNVGFTLPREANHKPEPS